MSFKVVALICKHSVSIPSEWKAGYFKSFYEEQFELLSGPGVPRYRKELEGGPVGKRQWGPLPAGFLDNIQIFYPNAPQGS